MGLRDELAPIMLTVGFRLLPVFRVALSVVSSWLQHAPVAGEGLVLFGLSQVIVHAVSTWLLAGPLACAAGLMQ